MLLKNYFKKSGFIGRSLKTLNNKLDFGKRTTQTVKKIIIKSV